jgi:hypothetical protein
VKVTDEQLAACKPFVVEAVLRMAQSFDAMCAVEKILGRDLAMKGAVEDMAFDVEGGTTELEIDDEDVRTFLDGLKEG